MRRPIEIISKRNQGSHGKPPYIAIFNRKNRIQNSPKWSHAIEPSTASCPAIPGAADWRGHELAASTSWIDRITSRQARELTSTVEAVMEAGRTMANVGASDFPIPSLAGDLAKARDALEVGRGIHLFRGLPVEHASIDALRMMYWGIGAHLGTAVS